MMRNIKVTVATQQPQSLSSLHCYQCGRMDLLRQTQNKAVVFSFTYVEMQMHHPIPQDDYLFHTDSMQRSIPQSQRGTILCHMTPSHTHTLSTYVNGIHSFRLTRPPRYDYNHYVSHYNNYCTLEHTTRFRLWTTFSFSLVWHESAKLPLHSLRRSTP